MSEVRIRCINKDNGNHDNPYEAITHYGWLEDGEMKKTDRQTMVDWVKKGNVAYVEDNDGHRADCKVEVSAHGTEFLQTYSDRDADNNLLNLKECV